LPAPESIIQTYTNYKAIIAIFRSLLTAASLWMTYRIYRTLGPRTGKESESPG
jgi:hypothetical protein